MDIQLTRNVPNRIQSEFPALVLTTDDVYALGFWTPDYELVVDFGYGYQVVGSHQGCSPWAQLAIKPKTDGSNPHPKMVSWCTGFPNWNGPTLLRARVADSQNPDYHYALCGVGVAESISASVVRLLHHDEELIETSVMFTRLPLIKRFTRRR